MNIYQKILAIQNDLAVVAKSLQVSTGKSSKGYKAVSERDVIDAVKPLECQHGVCSYPINREIIDDEILESESTYGGQTSKKTTFFTRIKTTYRFVNADDPTDYIDTIVYSEGIDSQDKGSGKAMTYADKYALLKVYKVSTGDDPDQTASTDTQYTAKTLSQSDIAELKSIIASVDGLSEATILRAYKTDSFDKIPASQYGDIIRRIEDYVARRQAK